MKKAAACLFVFILLAALGIGLTPQSASDLFQKALTKEKAEGNLEEAIALFQQVVDKGGDEALAAQAQLHIGICYEKLGLGKARESYQKVIDRYPRQAEAVRAARENLASLANAAPRIAGGIRDFTIRRVYDGTGPEWGNGLSSDGRYLAYTD
ncbi:MAG: tetratricopeptide repeat protein [Candidatus Aminicenantes bacterium]|nr:tetratricopeptide repeat protein [Candidatus Aminicenantes bacterium]